MDDRTLQEFKKLRNIKEIIDYIRPYYPDLNVAEFKIETIEKALYHIYIKLIGRILLFSPQNMRSFLKIFLSKYEITNIKHLIIGSIVGLSKEEKLNNINFIVEEYLDNTEFIKKLSQISNPSEIQLYMKGTNYNKAVREGLLYFKNNNEIFVLGSFLDRIYYENLMKQKRFSNKKERDIINTYIDWIIEIYNLKMIYRGIKNKIDKKLLAQFLVKNYLFFNAGKIQKLLNQANIEEFFNLLQEYLNEMDQLKDIRKIVILNKEHFNWSLEGLYQQYYFKKLKIEVGNIENITIFRIMELLIKKEKEISFDIIPHVINILHGKYELLDK